ncbi:MAG: hypothetical protein MUC33_23765 [Desulfobacterales bacterium]|nr:hypothetical protein [Desulfobacterales bacterium]
MVFKRRQERIGQGFIALAQVQIDACRQQGKGNHLEEQKTQDHFLQDTH